MTTSGTVPTPKLDGGCADLRLIGGEREGLDWFFQPFSEVLSTKARDLCVNFILFYGVLCVKLYIHQL
jgi:hypothetical protein